MYNLIGLGHIIHTKFSFLSIPDLLYRQTLNVNNSMLEVEIVDVCSCELSFPEEAIYWADACIVVYDVTSRDSLNHAVELLQRIQQLRTQILTVLLGNKCDLEHLREVSINSYSSNVEII